MVLSKITKEQENLNLFVVMEVKVKPLSKMIKKMAPQLHGTNPEPKYLKVCFKMGWNMATIPNGSGTEVKKRKGYTLKGKNKGGLISITVMGRNYIFKHTKMEN